MVSLEKLAEYESYLEELNEHSCAQKAELSAALSRGKESQDSVKAKHYKLLPSQRHLFDARQEARVRKLDACICDPRGQGGCLL